jgi:hypothetical protein
MAKGDPQRVQNAIDYRGTTAQNRLNNVWDKSTDQWHQLWNNYLSGTQQNLADYGNIMGQYGDFARTGGYSPEDLQNIRARSVSPLRSVYSSAQSGLDRNRALQGGYSPNYAAASSKMAREMGQGMADANTNTNAAIAQMVQQGKLAGLGGMSSLYGATPGLSSMFGNQALTSTGQQIGLSGLQNQLGLGLINAQMGRANTPGFNWDPLWKGISAIGGIAGGMGGGGGQPQVPGWSSGPF